MAITNYTELQTALSNWLARSDLTSRIPEFIALGEALLNREIKHPEMVTEATVSTSTSTRYAALPTGFLELQSLIDTYGDPLVQVSSEEAKSASVGAGTGLPAFFAISSQFEFDCVSNQVYSLTCFYRKKLSIANDSTNWLLTKYPDAYLYASLLQAQPFLRNDPRVPMLAQLLDGVISNVNSVSKNRRKLRVDEALTSNGGYNIVKGY